MKSNSKKGEINGDKTKKLKTGEIFQGKERKQIRRAMGGKGESPQREGRRTENPLTPNMNAVPKMSVVMHSFVPLLLSHQVHPVPKQHTRLIIDTMKRLSPAAQTLKLLRISYNKCFLGHLLSDLNQL
jgi:hypothetical protein